MTAKTQEESSPGTETKEVEEKVKKTRVRKPKEPKVEIVKDADSQKKVDI